MMFNLPTALASASALRLPSLRASASGFTLDIDQNTRYTIPPHSTIAFDLQLVHMCMLSIEKGQAPQRVIGQDQWTVPANPAPAATDNRGAPLFKPGMLLPVAVLNGNQVQPAEMMVSTIGARTSIEGLFAQVAVEMNAAGSKGRDVVVTVQFAGTQTVPMGAGNSFRLLFENVQVIDTPAEMIAFRSQFKAVVEHAKRTPPKLPVPTSFAAPAIFGAPAGGTSGWAPPMMSQPQAFVAAPAAPTFQSAAVPPSAAHPWQPTSSPQAAATPPWLQAPQAPMAPAAPEISGAI